jgi:HAT1-interacting factor 1
VPSIEVSISCNLTTFRCFVNMWEDAFRTCHAKPYDDCASFVQSQLSRNQQTPRRTFESPQPGNLYFLSLCTIIITQSLIVTMADTTEVSDLPVAAAPSAAPPTTSTPISNEDRLASLVAQATAKYAIKDYLPAADFYSQATELQAELNGEMAVENADLLYSYGKCLYFVAVKNSDVLGGEAAGAKLGPQKPGLEKKPKSTTDGRAVITKPDEGRIVDGEQRQTEEVVTALVEERTGDKLADTTKDAEAGGDKPYFQFTGDENWDDSEEEEDADGAAEEGEPEDENDDFANAFEVLDLARVLFLSRLEQLQLEASAAADKGKSIAPSPESPEVRTVKERIADIHDLQAEIALEGERFSNAVVDLKAALILKEQLLPKESSMLAECHYKLSLALEFSSVTQQRDKDGNPQGEATVDQASRDEAATHMHQAIESCKLRVAKADQELRALVGEEMAPKREKLKLDIEDVKEMIGDMQLRLVELKKPPVSINDPKGTGTLDGSTPLSGILGQILGESKAEQKKRLEEASIGAKDLTGLVKRKKTRSPAADEQPNTSNVAINGHATTNGKRKAVDLAEEVEEIGAAKKTKVEDAADA